MMRGVLGDPAGAGLLRINSPTT